MSGRDNDYEILPDTTSDEREDGHHDEDSSNDERLLAERPPHWD